jgi:hypothetical protein
MGAGQSSISHEQLFQQTRDTRRIMDDILNFMIKQVNIEDLSSLSNPTKCKEYMVLMANNLMQYFYKIRIFPSKTQDGVLFFRKVKDVADPSANSGFKEEKEALCLILAYYYTRVFQIYGALALTLIDDMQTTASTGTMPSYGRPAELYAPGQLPSKYGGAYFIDLGEFRFLEDFLKEDSNTFYSTKYNGTGDKDAIINFEKIAISNGRFTIMFEKNKPFAYVTIKAVRRNASSIEVDFGRELEYRTTTGNMVKKSIPGIVNRLIVKELPDISGSGKTYQIENTNQDVPSYFTEKLGKIVEFSRTLSTDIPSGSSSSSGSTNELYIQRIIKNLRDVRPLGHCIARALQLIDSQPIDNKIVRSHICKAKFIEKKSGNGSMVTRTGLPLPGQSLKESPGLASMSQLFYEIVNVASPQLIVDTRPGPDGVSAFQQYRDFMGKMASLFDGGAMNASQIDNLITSKKGLGGIINRRDQEACKGKEGDINLPIAASKPINVYVQKLFAIQLQHAKRCGALLNQLFFIQPDKQTGQTRIFFNENFVKKGLPEIQRISALARQILVDYYTNCETTYREGMQKVLSIPPVLAPTGTLYPPGPGALAPAKQGLFSRLFGSSGGSTRKRKNKKKSTAKRRY